MGKTKRTIREKKFIKAYIENGGNATKAYLAVNETYKGNSAKELGRRMLTKVDLSDDEIMEELGLTDAYIYEKIKEGTEAIKTDKTGDEIADYAVRHQYIDTILKLTKKYPAEKREVDLKGDININAKEQLLSRINSI
ncbi:MAG: hypothetical protein ACOCUH_02770, partial [Bacteriovoracia bacterium]